MSRKIYSSCFHIGQYCSVLPIQSALFHHGCLSTRVCCCCVAYAQIIGLLTLMWPVNSPHIWPVTRKLILFDDVIMRQAVITQWYTSHYDDVIMDSIASQITSLTIVYSTAHLGADQSKNQSSASLAFVWEIHRWPVNLPHKWPVTRKMFPFDDVIMPSI